MKGANNTIFEVNDGTLEFLVDMGKKTCACKKFQTNQIPCSHAFAVISDRYAGVYEHCSKYYTKDELFETYKETIFPLGNESTWNVPCEIKDVVVLPPVSKKKSGRPRKKRLRSFTERKIQKSHCSRCGESGHYRTTCTKPAALHPKMS